LGVQDGIYAHWWTQHNEHRLLLARVLFWMDMRWFGGAAISLVVASHVLAATAALLFWAAMRHHPPAGAGPGVIAVAGLLVTAWLFQWMQEENFTLGFQVQFFLA